MSAPLFRRGDWITVSGERRRVWRCTTHTITTALPGTWRWYLLAVESWFRSLWRRVTP